MKVEINVCGLRTTAVTDYCVPPSLSLKDQVAIETALFSRLCSEARAAAKDYIVGMPVAALLDSRPACADWKRKEGGAK